MRPAIALFVLSVLVLTASIAPAANHGVHSIDVGRVWWTWINVTGSPATYRVETVDLKGGADTMIYIWDLKKEKTVSWADDRPSWCTYPGGPTSTFSSCAEVTLSPGSYAVFVFAHHGAATTGTADVIVRRDGVQTARYEDIPVGGTWTRVDAEPWDTVQTVLLANGADDTVLFGFLAKELVAIDVDGGVGKASRLTGRKLDWVVTGNHVGVIGHGGGPTRLLVNDHQDSDGDGLGYKLEAA